MLKRTLFLLHLLFAISVFAGVGVNDSRLNPSAHATAAGGGTVAIAPFSGAVRANALLVRCKLLNGKNYVNPVKANLTCGSLAVTKEMLPLDRMFNHGNTDYELPLDTTVSLDATAKLELSFPLENDQEMEVFSVLPVIFRPDDLSQGITFEDDDHNGVWLAHDEARIEMDDVRGLSGKRCIRCEWPRGNDMVSLLPGQRDWRGFAALRLTVANPLPGADGRRNRIMFLNDGKQILRPSTKDTIPSGSLEVLPEGVQIFQLDLKVFAKNNPKFNLGNVQSLQIFWSPKVCGDTIYYIDDVKLLTKAELQAEEDAEYLGRIDALKAESQEMREMVAALRERHAKGERESLKKLLVEASELEVVEQLAKGSKEMRLYWVSAARKVMRDALPEANPFPLDISAAGNERESFQLLIAPGRALKNVRVAASRLEAEAGGGIAPLNATVNPIAYLEVVANDFLYKEARPGMWPDVLLDNAPFDLPKKIQPYMVTVAVPSGQPAGVYRGTLTVTADGVEPSTVEYRCKVRNFSLPVRGELKTWFSMNFIPQDRELRKMHYDIYFDYRLNPVSMYNFINRDKPGYAKHDCFPPVEDLPYCLERGLNFLPFGYLYDYYHAKESGRPKTGWDFQDEYIQDVIKVVETLKPQLEKAGVWDIAHINGFDEIMHKRDILKPRMAAALKICKALKRRFPDLKLANVGKRMDIDNSLMDTWFMSPTEHESFRDIQEKGGTVGFYWVYHDPSFMLDQPGIAPRICAWLAYKEGATGMGTYSTFRPHDVYPDRKASMERHPKALHARCTEECMMPNPPTGLDWPASLYVTTSPNGPGRNCDGKLFHPAPGGRLLASQRLVNIRDGIEDYEYFKMLEKLPGDHKALLAIGDEIITVRQGDYTTDISILETRRNAVAEAIEAAQRK